jgi:hypothetical protein
MDDYFESCGKVRALSAEAADELETSGFVVVPGPYAQGELSSVAEAYDAAFASAAPEDVRVGSTTNRVSDLVNRGPEFDRLYIFPPLLEACYRTIRQPFKLSNMLGRTLRPGARGPSLHVDFAADEKGWPMVGFIFMVDEFRAENGATRFAPGSHRRPLEDGEPLIDPCDAVAACGPAGSVIVYNGSVWHEHGANTTSAPRRSIQGAFTRREADGSVNWSARMLPETLTRLGPLAKYLLGI